MTGESLVHRALPESGSTSNVRIWVPTHKIDGSSLGARTVRPTYRL
jgi:hypothetical protein